MYLMLYFHTNHFHIFQILEHCFKQKIPGVSGFQFSHMGLYFLPKVLSKDFQPFWKLSTYSKEY